MVKNENTPLKIATSLFISPAIAYRLWLPRSIRFSFWLNKSLGRVVHVCMFARDGGHLNMKAYRKTKVGAFGVRFYWKKGVIQCGRQKWDLFWCGLLKMGVILSAKMQFYAKFCKFYVEIANISKCAQCVRKFNLHVKFDTKVEKGVIWRGLRKRGCKISVEKGVYWQALDIYRHMGVPPGMFALLTLEATVAAWQSPQNLCNT